MKSAKTSRQFCIAMLAGIISLAGVGMAGESEPFGWSPVETDPLQESTAATDVHVSIRYEAPDNSLPKQVEHPVVIEQFTAVWCAYCYSVGMALDRLRTERQMDEVLMIAYHSNDAYQTTYGNARFSLYSVGSIPTVIMNGTRRLTGGNTISSGQSGIDSSYNSISSMFLTEQATTTQSVDILMSGDFRQTGTSMQIVINTHAEGLGTARLYVMAVEDAIPVTASNGLRELSFTHRAALLDQQVNLSSPTKATIDLNYPGTIPCRDAACLRPVVFLQDNTTRRIIAADATVDLPPFMYATGWESYE